MSDRSISVNTSQRRYEIVIEVGLLPKIGHFLAREMSMTKTVTVSDENVWGLYGDTLLKSLKMAGIATYPLILKPGESSKTIETVTLIYDHLINIRANRNTPLLALGGGVVGDVAGFAASTFMRGLPLFHVPTSLLAQVDSCIGGKVGIDHPKAKNLIGSFYQPVAVFIDPTLLSTLPASEIRNGLAEIIKTGLITDGGLLDFLSSDIEKVFELDTKTMEFVIAECCAFKAGVVEQDEFDRSLRSILNYGHTIGHAVEAAGNFELFSHGEAVSIGMVAAAALGRRLGYLTEGEVQAHTDLIIRAGLPKDCGGKVALEKLEKTIKMDKKATDEGLVFILLHGLGNPFVDKNVPEELVRESLASILGG